MECISINFTNRNVVIYSPSFHMRGFSKFSLQVIVVSIKMQISASVLVCLESADKLIFFVLLPRLLLDKA